MYIKKFFTYEEEKKFWEEMKICKGNRKDGKDGQCINSQMHNLGCYCCPIENGLYEPNLIQ